MSNSRSFRRALKGDRHVRTSGHARQPKRQPWNKGLALTTRPSLSTTRRWLEACVAEGWAERKGTERTGKPGRPAVLYGLTEAGLERAKNEPPVSPEAYMNQVRRQANARKRRRMQRGTRRLNTLNQKAAKAGRKVTATTEALKQAEARVLAAETAVCAIKALSEADGDLSVLLPEEIDTLTEVGILAEKDGQVLLAENCLEAYDRAQLCITRLSPSH